MSLTFGEMIRKCLSASSYFEVHQAKPFPSLKITMFKLQSKLDPNDKIDYQFL